MSAPGSTLLHSYSTFSSAPPPLLLGLLLRFGAESVKWLKRVVYSSESLCVIVYVRMKGIRGLSGRSHGVWKLFWTFFALGVSHATTMEPEEEEDKDGALESLKDQLENCTTLCLVVLIAALIGIG